MVVFLPAILPALRRLAPHANVRSVSLPAEEIANGLESGTIDLALGHFPDLKRHNFFQQTLFSDSFTCLLRADHPVRSARLNLRQFLQLEHAVVRAESRTEEVIDSVYWCSQGIKRRVCAHTPHFAVSAHSQNKSDLIVTVPSRSRATTPASRRGHAACPPRPSIRPHRPKQLPGTQVPIMIAQSLATQPDLRALQRAPAPG